MKRHASLVPLSHNHHGGLVFARRLRRALEGNWEPLEALRAKFQELWETELEAHFRAEERLLAPAMESAAPERARPYLDRLAQEHRELRDLRDRVLRERDPDRLRQQLLDFSHRLPAHIRFEERELFEAAQELIPPDQLESLAAAIQQMAPAPRACSISLPPGQTPPPDETDL